MADAIPIGLRQDDVNIYKCATKATQLQRVKPIVAYWCEYWVVNQILAKQLHSSSEEMLQYTTTLMDKLEQTKSEFADEEAITDDIAGQAYIEQFAQETLDRAERVVKANKVTQQTAQTFDAAATFFHLVNIWGDPDQETQQKIKYAKWNAARIAKAIKDGKDPNESNPKPQDIPQPALNPDDPDVQMLGVSPSPRPATAEDAPDADLRKDDAGVSPPQSPADRAARAGDGPNLPGVPTHLGQQAQPGYFDPPSMPSPISPAPSNQQSSWQPTPPPPPNTIAYAPPPTAPAAPPSRINNTASTPAVVAPPTRQDSHNVGGAPAASSSAPQPASRHAPAPQQTGNYNTDEAAIIQAQKHAKWAISALNFEDVPTAVKELKRALATLGAP